MDQLDRKILNIIQRDSGCTAAELAQQVPLSASAITRRIQRMRSEGVIEREVALIASSLREQQLTGVMHIQLERHTPSDLSGLKSAFLNRPEIQLCYEITGASDMMLVVSVPNMERLNEFADWMSTQSLIRRYETSLVKKQIKYSLAVQLD